MKKLFASNEPVNSVSEVAPQICEVVNPGEDAVNSVSEVASEICEVVNPGEDGNAESVLEIDEPKDLLLPLQMKQWNFNFENFLKVFIIFYLFLSSQHETMNINS